MAKTSSAGLLTATEISDRLESAALTLRRLPNPPGSTPKAYGSSWPAVVQEAKHAYGYHEARMRIVPSAKEIQEMEEAIEWLLLLDDPTDRHILWMRAENHRWRTICHRVGLVRQTCHRRAIAAVLTIEKKLAKAAKPKRQPIRTNPEGGSASASR